MYKKQMKLQKILCLVALAASALVFIYSLGMMTDLYDSLYGTMTDPSDLSKTTVPGSMVYYDMQPFNNAFLKAGLALILLSCLLFITHTHSRRKYYTGNYLSVAALTAAGVGISIWADGRINEFRAQFLSLDFQALAKHAKRWKTLYTESTFWFDVHYAVFAVLLLTCLALVACTVWKILLMRQERALIAAGEEAGV